MLSERSGRHSLIFGNGRETLTEVREWSGGPPEVRDSSGGPPEDPGVVLRPSGRSWSGREALVEV